MLHGTDARPLGPEHANAAPGVAYLSGLGRDCERIRVPYLGEYGEYVDRIQHHGRRAALMNLIAIVIIAGLVTALLIKSHKAAPALVVGRRDPRAALRRLPDARARPSSSSAGEFAHQLGAATDRAADVPQED